MLARLLLQDDAAQFKRAKALLGSGQMFTAPLTVMLELVWVLESNEPRLSIRDFHADLRETGSPACAHKPSNQCRRWRATAKRSVGMSGVTLGFSQNAPTASTL